MSDQKPTSPSQDDLAAEKYLAWRREVADRLFNAQRYGEAENFRMCGEVFGNFQVRLCEEHPEHEAQIVPFTCHLRYCPDCERREQARKVERYVPILKELAEQDDKPGWSLKKLDLTTPFSLDDPDAAELYDEAWRYLETMLQKLFMFLLQHELTPREQLRQRVSLKAHGVGVLAAAEFGEHGHKLHFHLLMYSPFAAKQVITDLWRESSGGTCEINWIRRIEYHGVEDAVKEQVKYITKFTELPPRLVVALADVLDGSRRLRSYGVVRGQPEAKFEALCASCGEQVKITTARHYFELCISRNITPDPLVYAAGENIFLDLKHGNKAGETSRPTARSDPDQDSQQQTMPGLGEVEVKKEAKDWYWQL